MFFRILLNNKEKVWTNVNDFGTFYRNSVKVNRQSHNLQTWNSAMPAKKKNKKTDRSSNKADNYWKKKQEANQLSEKLYSQTVFYDWCKACRLCIELCPKNVYGSDKTGRPVIEKPDACNGCRFCEVHCPDFAISIKERYPDRRRKPNGQ